MHFTLTALAVCLTMGLRPSTQREILQAIGSIEGLPLTLRRALDPGSDFDPILPPNPGDWLAEHYEEGQTHDDFIRTGKNKPDALRNTIYRSDARPMSFCPVCLRKIHHSVGFDVIDRYRRLLLFHENIGFTDEARWLQKRLKRITGHDNGK